MNLNIFYSSLPYSLEGIPLEKTGYQSMIAINIFVRKPLNKSLKMSYSEINFIMKLLLQHLNSVKGV